MTERWVINASPLIVLARIGREDFLFSVTDHVVVPRAVALEIEAGPADDRSKQLVTAGRFRIVDTPLPPSELSAWDLGPGETAVLSLALSEQGWTAILDDAAARRCARSFSVPLKGTLAVVILAKQRGLIPSAAEVIRSLQMAGFRLDDDTIQDALARTVREVWMP